MADVQLLNPTDIIKDSYGKINYSITNINTDLIAAYNSGFLGLSAGLPSFSDFDDVTTPGTYHGVYENAKTNEPIQSSGTRRVTLRVEKAPGVTMQRITYEGGVGAGREFFRIVGETTGWHEIYTTESNLAGLTNPGYQKLASGFIIQWGFGSTSSGVLTVTLPISYPANHLVTIPVADSLDTNIILTTANYTTSSVDILCNAAYNVSVRWVSIGF